MPKISMAQNNDFAIAVLTADTADSMLAGGGSGDWVVDPDKASAYTYVVCCRNQSWRNRKDKIEDRAAFLVGTIAGLREQPDSTNSRGQKRYLIEMSSYALINVPNAWPKGHRNPVAYRTLKELGIDLRRVKLKPLPLAAAGKPDASARKPMTIAEAKQALAESLGVRPEDVEITIRG